MTQQLYSNIKRLRKQMNMSQQELAEAVGYKGKSMIAQIENGRVDLSASMISKFARVFHVSEHELMGLEDDQAEDAVKRNIVDIAVPNADDRIVLELYHNVPEDKKQLVDILLRSLQPFSGNQNPDDENNN